MGMLVAEKHRRRALLAHWEAGESMADVAAELAVTETDIWNAVDWATRGLLRSRPPQHTRRGIPEAD